MADLFSHLFSHFFVRPVLHHLVDTYGLEYYWWYWPALIVIGVISVVALIKLRRYRKRFRTEHPELAGWL